MTDLTSPEMQSTFKKLERTTLVTNVTMCVITLLAAAIAIWGSASVKGEASWSEVMFYVLIAVLAVYFTALLVWEIVLRHMNSKAMHAFVAETFMSAENFFSADLINDGKTVELETSLAGDKLVVMRSDGGKYVELDLAPIRNYSSVCAYTVRLTKRYVRDYYNLAAQRGEAADVVLINRVQGRGRKSVYVKDGKPKFGWLSKYGYYIRHGLIK